MPSNQLNGRLGSQRNASAAITNVRIAGMFDFAAIVPQLIADCAR